MKYECDAFHFTNFCSVKFSKKEFPEDVSFFPLKDETEKQSHIMDFQFCFLNFVFSHQL